MSWSSSAPSGVSFSSSTEVVVTKSFNYYTLKLTIRTARGTGNTYYVRVKTAFSEGTNGYYQKNSNGVWWFVGSDSQNYDMPDSINNQTRYYTGSRGSSGTIKVGVSTSSNLSNSNSAYSDDVTIAAATYAVTYDGNGSDDGSTSAQTKTYNVNLTLRANGFTRTGYTFDGWNTKADGTGTSYAAGDTYSGNAALNLYAQWQRANIPLYVNVDGTIHQVEKAYINVSGAIKECAVYANVGGTIKTFV